MITLFLQDVPHWINFAKSSEHYPYPTADRRQTATHETADLQRIRYRTEPQSDGTAHVLMRTTTTMPSNQTERVIPIGEHVRTVKMRYFDGQMWYDTWQREALPLALELTVGLDKHGWDARTHYFTTVITTQ